MRSVAGCPSRTPSRKSYAPASTRSTEGRPARPDKMRTAGVAPRRTLTTERRFSMMTSPTVADQELLPQHRPFSDLSPVEADLLAEIAAEDGRGESAEELWRALQLARAVTDLTGADSPEAASVALQRRMRDVPHLPPAHERAIRASSRSGFECGRRIMSARLRAYALAAVRRHVRASRGAPSALTKTKRAPAPATTSSGAEPPGPPEPAPSSHPEGCWGWARLVRESGGAS